MLICICMNADWYVLLPLCIWMIMFWNMFYVFKYHASTLYICMFMFMGLDAQMIWYIVASSSSVGGLGMLQCGIRALVAAWAWMGREDEVTELCCSIGPQRAMRTVNSGRLPTAQKKPGTWVKTRKFTNFSKCFGRQHIETLRQMDRWCLVDWASPLRVTTELTVRCSSC